MTRATILACALAAAFAFTACTGGGARKLVIDENVCAGVDLLRMRIGDETRIVVDNSTHVERQEGIQVEFIEFPVAVVGELPPNAQVGANFTTMRLDAPPGEEAAVTVRPLFTGDYTARCHVILNDSGGQTQLEFSLKFQIVS